MGLTSVGVYFLKWIFWLALENPERGKFLLVFFSTRCCKKNTVSSLNFHYPKANGKYVSLRGNFGCYPLRSSIKIVCFGVVALIKVVIKELLRVIKQTSIAVFAFLGPRQWSVAWL